MSIFGGVEPPNWLTAIAKPAPTEDFSKDIGMMLGGGILALQPDPEKPNPDGTLQRKGFAKGLAEARMNQMDPQWKVKEAGLVAGVSQKWADASTQWYSLDQTAKNNALWASDESGKVAKWSDAVSKDWKTAGPPPVVTSPQARQAITAAETFIFKQQQLETARMAAENHSAATQGKVRMWTAFEKGLNEVEDDAERARIATMRNPQTLEPTPEGYEALAGAKKKAPAAVQAATVRNEGAKEIESMRETAWTQRENLRQDHRLAIEAIKETYGLNLLQKKLDTGATGKGGKVVTEDEFVLREMRGVMEDMAKANNLELDPKKKRTTAQIAQDADIVLHALWRNDHMPKKTDATTENKMNPGTAPTTKPDANAKDKLAPGTASTKVLHWDPDSETLK